MKLIGSKPIAAPRSIAAVPANSRLLCSIQSPTLASDQVKPPSNNGMIV